MRVHVVEMGTWWERVLGTLKGVKKYNGCYTNNFIGDDMEKRERWRWRERRQEQLLLDERLKMVWGGTVREASLLKMVVGWIRSSEF